jgi:hypothetical protein
MIVPESFLISTRLSDARHAPPMKTPIPLFLIIFSLTCFAFLSKSQAVAPPPDGGYPGGNTAEGHLAQGVNALFRNTAGGNTGIGANALRANTTGFQNTAVGHSALFDNTDGTFNTAFGASALTLNTSDGNTACGNVALFNNTGSNNTALGNGAGTNLTTGNNNIDIGYIVGG